MNYYTYGPYSGYYPTYSHGNDKDKNKGYQINYNIKVEGDGSVKAVPDMVKIEIGVETQNENLKIAQKENTNITNDVIYSLKEMDIDEKDIQTISYTVEKMYDYVRGERIFKGYKVVNRLIVTVHDVTIVGAVIDTAVEKGANMIGNIEFQLSNISDYYERALSLAVEDSVSKAKNIGYTLGIDVNNIPIKILEEKYDNSYSPGQPVYRAPEEGTTIESGEMEIKARVVAEFFYKY